VGAGVDFGGEVGVVLTISSFGFSTDFGGAVFCVGALNMSSPLDFSSTFAGGLVSDFGAVFSKMSPSVLEAFGTGLVGVLVVANISSVLSAEGFVAGVAALTAGVAALTGGLGLGTDEKISSGFSVFFGRSCSRRGCLG